MASDGKPVKIPAASLVHGSQAQKPVSIHQRSGKTLPASGKTVAASAAQEAARARSAASIEAQAAQLNKHLNDSGQPNQLLVDPNSDHKLIQQINPATVEVVGELLISDFPALARSLAESGEAVDS